MIRKRTSIRWLLIRQAKIGLRGKDQGRRVDPERDQSLVVSDNLAKGAALNAVQIAELLIQ